MVHPAASPILFPMKLAFLRDVLVHSQHRAAGSIHEISEREAYGLIADGAARPASEIETAAAPLQARESAVIPTKKARTVSK